MGFDMSLSDDYAQWQRWIDGEKIVVCDPPEKQCGFYKVRLKSRSRQWLPCSIFKANGNWYANRNGKIFNEPQMDNYGYGIFEDAVKNPITEQEYNNLMEVYHGE